MGDPEWFDATEWNPHEPQPVDQPCNDDLPDGLMPGCFDLDSDEDHDPYAGWRNPCREETISASEASAMMADLCVWKNGPTVNGMPLTFAT